ncbi:histidine phosphatase family protein [Leptospira kemamanensis]|uniref:Histidine phosphatase family protein n=1 Tax=Leptospira kemamanensis TaxID=2484942 RepID=A0A4R9JNY1_9LEPT|nr:histidine phosphatase family protein [Leptospira kemamanensis]TGL51708.1 histidine phosphatase family protein [Leptospira kemamanensis]
MSYLYLVRHGQADRLGKNYDQLTELGWNQAKLLGDYFKSQRIEFDSVYTGSLNRQKQTAEAIIKSFTNDRFCIPDPVEDSAWDEFDSRMWLGIAAKIRNTNEHFANLYESYKHAWEEGKEETRRYFQELIQLVLADWVNGVWDPVEPYTFTEYVEKVSLGPKHIPNDVKSTLVVSSSTPIAIMMGLSCKMNPKEFPIFMKSILNSSLSVFRRENNHWEPVCWNATPHLQDPDLITIV